VPVTAGRVGAGGAAGAGARHCADLDVAVDQVEGRTLGCGRRVPAVASVGPGDLRGAAGPGSCPALFGWRGPRRGRIPGCGNNGPGLVLTLGFVRLHVLAALAAEGHQLGMRRKLGHTANHRHGVAAAFAAGRGRQLGFGHQWKLVCRSPRPQLRRYP
jgi:hypothetical protein